MPVRYDADWRSAADAFKAAKLAFDDAKKNMDIARDNILALAPEDTSGFGVSVNYTERRGALDYAAIVKQHLPEFDAEPYRKASASVTNIKVSEE